jgi:hypothetical protein
MVKSYQDKFERLVAIINYDLEQAKEDVAVKQEMLDRENSDPRSSADRRQQFYITVRHAVAKRDTLEKVARAAAAVAR